MHVYSDSEHQCGGFYAWYNNISISIYYYVTAKCELICLHEVFLPCRVVQHCLCWINGTFFLMAIDKPRTYRYTINECFDIYILCRLSWSCLVGLIVLVRMGKAAIVRNLAWYAGVEIALIRLSGLSKNESGQVDCPTEVIRRTSRYKWLKLLCV